MNPRPPSRGLQWIAPVALLILVVLGFVVLNVFQDEPPRTPLQRGVEWLAARQQADGSWRGQEIAVLRPGPAMTAFVLRAMAPFHARYPDRIDRAVRYLESQVNADGIVGMTPQGPDYPNYATSLAVLSFSALKRGEASVARMVAYLKRAQVDESEGWTRDDPEYGGWAFGGPPQPKPTAHRLDISMTRFALEALSAAGVPANDPVWDRARRFLERMQNADGGFHFTTNPDLDKLGGASYGSATADGLLSLRFASGPKDRIDAAEKWIRDHFSAERCPGFPADHPRNWADGLFGYWLAAVTRAGEARSDLVTAALLSRQRPDGSWVNPVDLMLENEPLLATALAVVALTGSR